MRQSSKILKVLGITTAVFLAVSIPTYTYAKTVIGNSLLTTTVAAKNTITWKSKTIFKKTVKVKKKLTVLGATILNSLTVSGDTTLAGLTVADTSALNDVTVAGDLTLANGLGLGSLTGLTAGQVVMGNSEGTPTATTLTGDVTVDSAGVTTLATGAVDVTGVATSTSDDGTVTDGVMKYRYISSDAVIPLLNGESNTLTTLDEGEVIIDVIFAVGAASGIASTVDIGTDENWSEAASDTDAFISTHDLNSIGSVRMTLQDEANQTTAANGDPAKVDDAAVLIQSSADVSNTTVNATATILYY